MGYVLRRQATFFSDFHELKFYLARLGKKEKKVKTIYLGDIAYYMDLKSGEILRKKKSREILTSLHSSIRRTERLCRLIVDANNWKYFVSLTFDDEVVDRHDDKKVLKQFVKWRENIRRKFPNLKYWGAPERHEDGALHFHFLMTGVSDEQLGLINSGKKNKNNQEIFNVTAWKNGFSTLCKIDGESAQAKVQNYVMKYIRKCNDVLGIGRKRFWNTKNCARCAVETDEIPIDFYDSVDFGKDEELLLKQQVSVYNIAIRDIPKTDLTSVYFCDFSKNFCVIRDNGKSKLRRLKRLFSSGKISIL